MVLNVHGSNYSVQTAIYVNQKLHMSNFIAFNVKLPGPLDK
jgi:hypothetical protein